MPWLAVEKEYVFIGPEGKVRLLDLFDGRRQLILYQYTSLCHPDIAGLVLSHPVS